MMLYKKFILGCIFIFLVFTVYAEEIVYDSLKIYVKKNKDVFSTFLYLSFETETKDIILYYFPYKNNKLSMISFKLNKFMQYKFKQKLQQGKKIFTLQYKYISKMNIPIEFITNIMDMGTCEKVKLKLYGYYKYKKHWIKLQMPEILTDTINHISMGSLSPIIIPVISLLNKLQNKYIETKIKYLIEK